MGFRHILSLALTRVRILPVSTFWRRMLSRLVDWTLLLHGQITESPRAHTTLLVSPLRAAAVVLPDLWRLDFKPDNPTWRRVCDGHLDHSASHGVSAARTAAILLPFPCVPTSVSLATGQPALQVATATLGERARSDSVLEIGHQLPLPI